MRNILWLLSLVAICLASINCTNCSISNCAVCDFFNATWCLRCNDGYNMTPSGLCLGRSYFYFLKSNMWISAPEILLSQ